MKQKSSRRPLSKIAILHAQELTQVRSHKEVALYLDVSYATYKKYAKKYGIFTDFKERKLNKGLAFTRKRKEYSLEKLLSGSILHYSRSKLAERLIFAGWIKPICTYCNYSRCLPDGRGPFLLLYKDENSNNLALDNLALCCYNCNYLISGTIRDRTGTLKELPPASVEEKLKDTSSFLTEDDIADIQQDMWNESS